MKKLTRRVLLLTCILSLQLIKPVTSLYASPLKLTYDGKEHTYNKAPITLEIDNEEIEMAIQPLQIEGTTLVSTRGVFEAMGATVDWKAAERAVYVTHGNTAIKLEVDDPNGWVDGDASHLEMPPKMINGSVMVPFRFVGEALGYKVDWNHDSRNIKINQRAPDKPIVEKPAPDEPVIEKPALEKPAPEKPTVEAPRLITEVEDVTVKNHEDRVSIYTIHLTKPAENFTSYTEASKVVVDVDNATNYLASHMWLADNPYVSEVRTSQFTGDKTRVVFDLTQEVTAEAKLSGDKKTITITMKGTKEPVPDKIELENFRYTNKPREAIAFQKAPGMSVSAITVNNDYRNKKTTITLPGNFGHLFEDKVMEIGSRGVQRIVIKTGNQTTIEIYENEYRAYEVIEEGREIKVIFMQPREKYSKIVLLDLGHGGKDPGATGNGLREKDLVLEQGRHIHRLLENDPNIKVYITRETDTYPSNSSRAKLANDLGADLFVSLHANSFTGGNANGTETLYNPNSTKSKQAAQILQKNLVRELGMFNRNTKPRTNLLVLNQTNMPAILIETGFISHPGDAAKFKSPDFNKKVGQVIYDSIVEVFNTVSFR